jgi:hypothetical protein
MLVKMRKCYSCEADNADTQTYCGFCGSPLKLGDFLARKVSEELATKIRDRDVIEMESSIKVFEKAWGWVKTVLSIAALLVAILGAGIFWKASDLWSSVNKAKQTVQSTALSSEQQIRQSSASSLAAIGAAAASATDASKKASSEVNNQAKEAVQLTSQLKTDLNLQANSVRADVGHARTELEAVNQLRPQMTAMQGQLTGAIATVQAQQKTLSSSEEFVKQVFSSHMSRFFSLADFVSKTVIVIPRKDKDKGNSIVYLLLPEEPIEETIQLQYKIYVQPRNSFLHIKNVVVFFWGDSPDNLKQEPLVVSYFPDTSDKDIAHSLSLRDGRVFADDEPLPKFNEADPEFRGNRWVKVTSQP